MKVVMANAEFNYRDAFNSGLIEQESITQEDIDLLKLDAKTFLDKGWPKHDVIRFLCATEHVDPLLDEDTALKRMRQIVNKNNPKLVKTLE